MLRRIIVGLNGSKFSQDAAETAIVWGQRYGIEVVGVSVIDLPNLASAEPVPLGGSAYKTHRDQTIIEAAHADADRLLAEFAYACQSRQVPCQMLKREGDPAAILVLEAQRGDLLLVGRKRVRDDDERASDTLEHILRSATRPVITVPAGGVTENHAVLVAYDGSPQAAKALQAFQSLGLGNARAIHVLSVARNAGGSSAAELAADYLRLHSHEIHVHSEVSQLPPGDVILSEARRFNAGMIVMGSYGRARVAELFFGSVTRSVINSSTVPLFLYH